MTRKDYVAIAHAFAVHRPSEGPPGHNQACNMWVSLQKKLADAFEIDNPRFNRSRFYAACKVTP